jgi:hypothetical protein
MREVPFFSSGQDQFLRANFFRHENDPLPSPHLPINFIGAP